MALPVTVPVASSSAPGRIIEWYRSDGEELHQGDPIACVECDDVVFDLEAEADGVLHQRAEAGGPAAPANILAFIASRGEAVPTTIPEIAAAPQPHLPPVDYQGSRDFVPGMPIPLRRGALGPPREFVRGGAWDRVFGTEDDGHIDDLWPHTDEVRASNAPAPVDVLGFPVAAEPVGDSFQQEAQEVDQAPPVPEFAIPATGAEDVEAFSYFDAPPGQPAVEESPLSLRDGLSEAPGVEVSPAEAVQVRQWLEDQPVLDPLSVEPATEAPSAVIESAPVYIPPPPLLLRSTVRMTEARKLCDQLGREWREAPARPENEDLILRAIARAAAEQDMVPSDGGAAGLIFPVAGGDTVAVLHGAARGSFKEQVARLAQAPRALTFEGCSYTLVSFRTFGIEEATPHLPEGHAVAFAIGALRPGVRPEGSDLPSPVVVLTMAYNPDALSMGHAAILFARVAQLIEAPYALLAD